MGTLESIGWVVFFMSGIVVCVYALYTLIKWKKEMEQLHIEYQSHIEYRKYLKSLIPGSIWVEREQHLPENPFESQDLQVVKVIETRMNHFGELWVRYMQQGHSHEASAYDFGKVYKIMEE